MLASNKMLIRAIGESADTPKPNSPNAQAT
jgi:hypothetical protein